MPRIGPSLAFVFATLVGVLLSLGHARADSPKAAVEGSVVAIGGALQDDNDAIWSRVVQLAGGAGSRFVVMTYGSSQPEESAAWYIQHLSRHGAVVTHVREAGPLTELAQARGVFLGGGVQAKLMETLAPGGQPTALLLAIRDVLKRGGVVAGTSAGAAVLSEWMFTHGEPLEVLKGTAGTVHARGLGLVASGVLVDQHFIARGRIGRLVPLLMREGIAMGLGVDEDSAAVIRGQEVEVIGSRGVLVVDTRAARSDANTATVNTSTAMPFKAQSVRLSWLESGDRLDLVSGRVTPSARKLATRAIGPQHASWRPYFHGEHVFTDLLSGNAVLSAMQRLVDSRLPEVVGLSFDATTRRGGPTAELGFRWRFTRGADTSAWSAGDRYTIASVLLDVQPVRMASPLFTPWP